MKKDRFRLLLITIISLMMLVGVISAQEIDTRIWSQVYWQKLANQGLVEVAKQTTVPDAVYTGSDIHARTVLVDDSPDVPVTANPNTTQSENSIFVNPLDNNKALNSNNSTDNPVNTVFGTSGFMTSDFGLNWNGSIQGTGGPNSGDPAACIDLSGRYYVGYIADDGGNGCAYSTNEGQSWTHVQVAPNPGSLADKNHLWVDNSPTSPNAGNLYATWTDFGGTWDSEVVLSRSTDNGLSWSSKINLSSAVNAGSHNQGVNVATGPNGEVYVTWAIYDSWPSDETALGFTKSLDGGATFDPATRIITNIRGIRTTETSKNHRVASFPAMDVDISGGPRDGRIYIVWTNYGTPGINNGPDIDNYMIYSSDGGATWSSPIRVNQDQPGQGKEHYSAWLTCDPVTGNLSVIMYDDRNVSSTMCEVYVANSTDGGNTWEDFKVSDVAFTPSPIPGLAGGYFGDYIGISARGGKVYPVWTDNRTGTALTYVSPFALADPTDPNPPGDVAAFSDYSTPNSIDLTWTDPTNLANGDTLFQGDFNIQILRDTVLIDSVAGGVGQYNDTNLNDGQQYSYTLMTKKTTDDSLSLPARVSWTAGGSPVPDPPMAFSLTNAGGGDLMAHWTNPRTNVDGTTMDDFAAINIYEDGTLLTTFTRSPGDTSKADSALFTPGSPNMPYYVTAVDNETPPNESVGSNTAYPPFIAPYLEDFESATPGEPGTLPVQWSNEIGDNFDWFVNEGGTPSTGTGPTVDHTTGTSTGNYMYTEASSPNYPNMVAYLTTPFVDLGTINNPGLIFWYHMHGVEMGELHVDVYAAGMWNLDVMPPIIGQQHPNQTDPWKQAVVDLSSYTSNPIQVRFRGITGSSFTSDMAIDDVLFGPVSAAPLMSVTPQALSDTMLIGDMSTKSFTVSNVQVSPSILNYTVTENPSVSWLSVSMTSGTLTTGQSDVLDVTVDATGLSSGTYTADLVIAGNDSTNLEDTVAVTLVANDAPSVRINPDSISLAVAPGEKDSTIFTIFNDGLGPLQILSMEDEEINTRGNFKPAFVQEQAPSGSHAKGEDPISNGGVMPDGAGGPDPFGYKWIDSDEPSGPPYVYTDISGTGTVVNLQPTGTFDEKDEGQATINLPWDVKFYGNTYNQLQVNSNGFITFDMNFFANAYTNDGIPNSADPNLIACAFWDDLDGSAGGDIYEQQNGNQYIIQWHNWGHYPSGTENMNFQVVLFQNSSTIWFVYEHIVDEANSTFGIENSDGTIGLQVAYLQSYAHDQLLTKLSKGADWMDQNPKSAVIAPGDSLDISLVADANGLTEGIYKGRVIMGTNDPLNETVTSPNVTLNVSSQPAPAISVSADSVNFDTTYVGFDSTISVMVSNIGNDTLDVTDMIITDPAFTVDTASFQLMPSASQEVKITFSPSSQGDYSGLIRCISNDPNNDTVDVYVEGYGATPTGIENLVGLPTTFDVAPNYPNPFNPTTTIKYQLPKASEVKLVIYNVLGQKVRTLVSQPVEAGYHNVVWDGTNDTGAQAASGIYIYRFQAEDFLKVQKMILMK